MSFLSVILAQAKKNYAQFFFGYSSIFWFLLLPFANGLLFYFMYLPFTRTTILFEWFGHILNVDIIGFTLIGQLLYSFYISTLISGSLLDLERQQGTFEAMLLTPANRMALLLGNTLGLSMRYLWLMVGVIVVFTFFFRVNFLISDFIAVLLTLLCSYLALVAFGLFLAALFIYSRRGALIGVASQEPVAFIAGVTIPQNAMPKGLAQTGYLIPLSIGLISMRLVLLGGTSLADVQIALISLLIMTVVYVVLAHFLIVIAEKSAKAAGTLTQF